MVGKGCWRDNMFVVRLWKSVKYEEVYLHFYDSVSEMKAYPGKHFRDDISKLLRHFQRELTDMPDRVAGAVNR